MTKQGWICKIRELAKESLLELRSGSEVSGKQVQRHPLRLKARTRLGTRARTWPQASEGSSAAASPAVSTRGPEDEGDRTALVVRRKLRRTVQEFHDGSCELASHENKALQEKLSEEGLRPMKIGLPLCSDSGPVETQC